jgi:hypothetical protein
MTIRSAPDVFRWQGAKRIRSKWVRMPSRPRLTYANVVSTLALFLALGGSAAYAAGKIQSGDIAPGAVHNSNVFKRAITSGKLAVGAVRSN